MNWLQNMHFLQLDDKCICCRASGRDGAKICCCENLGYGKWGRHNLAWGGISINYFPRELDLTFGGNIKSLTLMVLLVVLFSNISLLGAIKTQEELWWNWFLKNAKVSDFFPARFLGSFAINVVNLLEILLWCWFWIKTFGNQTLRE